METTVDSPKNPPVTKENSSVTKEDSLVTKEADIDVQTKNDLHLLQGEIQNMTTEDVTMEDINKLPLSDPQWVSPEGVMKAFVSLNRINPTLGKEIGLLIKQGDVLGIQLALGMVEGAKDSNKNADGVFGRSTLNNLGAGKVVKTNLTLTSKIVRGDEIIDLGSHMVRITNMNDVRKWGWSGDVAFAYVPNDRFSQIFYQNGRFVQKIDVTEPQSILDRATKGAQYGSDWIKGNWSYNENGQMVITYDGGIEKSKFTEEDIGAKMQLNQFTTMPTE